jgi:hypothetical protein
MKYSVKRDNFYGNILFAEGELPSFKYQVKRHLFDNYCADLYWGADEETGLVSFFYHALHDQSGSGGRVFHLPMEDGTVKSIKGPWCSSASMMNEYFPHSMEIVFVDNRAALHHSYSLLVDKAELVLKELGYDLILPFFKNQALYEIA